MLRRKTRSLIKWSASRGMFIFNLAFFVPSLVLFFLTVLGIINGSWPVYLFSTVVFGVFTVLWLRES